MDGDRVGEGEGDQATDAATLTLPPETRSVVTARRTARDVLRRWDAEELEWTVAQLVTELATNAVLHAGTPFRVTLRLQGERVRCEVSDGSPAPARMCHYSIEASTGRGLRLVDRLATSWGVTGSAGGKTVWFELDRVPVDTGDPDIDVLLDALDPSPGARSGAGPRGTQVRAA